VDPVTDPLLLRKVPFAFLQRQQAAVQLGISLRCFLIGLLFNPEDETYIFL
jgi:hypothetical protein